MHDFSQRQGCRYPTFPNEPIEILCFRCQQWQKPIEVSILQDQACYAMCKFSAQARPYTRTQDVHAYTHTTSRATRSSHKHSFINLSIYTIIKQGRDNSSTRPPGGNLGWRFTADLSRVRKLWILEDLTWTIKSTRFVGTRNVWRIFLDRSHVSL